MAIYLIGIAIGLLMIAIGAFNWDSWFVDYESRLVELLGGETLVRWYWGGAGLVLIVMTALYWMRVL